MEKGNVLAQIIKATAVVLLFCGIVASISVGKAYDIFYGLITALGVSVISMLLIGFGEMIQLLYEINMKNERIEAMLSGKKIKKSYFTGGSYTVPGEKDENPTLVNRDIFFGVEEDENAYKEVEETFDSEPESTEDKEEISKRLKKV